MAQTIGSSRPSAVHDERKSAASLESKAGTTLLSPEDTTYIIALMNLSTRWTAFAISLNGTTWNATPLVGQTCSYPATDDGIQRCFTEGRYQPIATTTCGQNLTVWFKFRNPQGDIGTLTDPYGPFYADCQARGKVLVFTD